MPRRPSTTTSHFRSTLACDGETLDYEIVLSQRRTMAIVIRRDGSITIRAPKRTPIAVIHHWAAQKAPWIQHKRQELAQRFPPKPTLRYEHGEIHSYLGQPYTLMLRVGERGHGWLADSQLMLPCPDSHSETVHNRLQRWYRRQAEEVFAQRLETCWPTFAARGLNKPTLHIRQMKTLWGSLARKQKMTLNLALIRAPEPLIDYVVVHELCHLEYHNHGPRFHALMDRMQPDWRERKRALEQCLL